MLSRLIVVSVTFGFVLSNAVLANDLPPQQFAEFKSCELASGETLTPCRIGYRTVGELNADKSNVVVVPTWHTGTSESHLMLTQTALDPTQYFIVIIDALSNGVSSSPSNHPNTAGGAFPTITIADMVDTQHRLLTETLDLQQAHAFVGLSMGGMQTFEWLVRYPDFAGRAVSTIGSPRLPTFDIALWTTNINLLALLRACDCEEARAAMAAQRMTLEVPSKLTADIPRERTLEYITKQVASDTMTLAQTWDKQRQAEAMITHNIARNFDDDMRKAAEQISARLLVIVGADDRVVTPGPAKAISTMVGGELLEMDSDCGHYEPLCSPDIFGNAVTDFLAAD
ncbi:MAG: alpha/beta fold hydrolase [Pseudomonadota bacterium]